MEDVKTQSEQREQRLKSIYVTLPVLADEIEKNLHEKLQAEVQAAAVTDSIKGVRMQIEREVLDSVDIETGKPSFTNQAQRDNETFARLRTNQPYGELLIIQGDAEIRSKQARDRIDVLERRFKVLNAQIELEKLFPAFMVTGQPSVFNGLGNAPTQ